MRLDERVEAMAKNFPAPLKCVEAVAASTRMKIDDGLKFEREIFLALTRPELGNIKTEGHRERFETLRSQLEDAVQAARDSRDSVVGSFDVLIARTGYRTNHIMKILTLTSVILLPGALIAGVMGMNFEASIFESSWVFYVVVALILAIAPLTLVFAKRRDWI